MGGGIVMGLVQEEYPEENPVIYYYGDSTYRFALYLYSDEPEIIYLSNVFVLQKNRRCGLGNLILKKAEKKASSMNANILRLKCEKDSWTHDWYKKYGFEDLCPDDDSQFVWMEKKLKD